MSPEPPPRVVDVDVDEKFNAKAENSYSIRISIFD